MRGIDKTRLLEAYDDCTMVGQWVLEKADLDTEDGSDAVNNHGSLWSFLTDLIRANGWAHEMESDQQEARMQARLAVELSSKPADILRFPGGDDAA